MMSFPERSTFSNYRAEQSLLFPLPTGRMTGRLQQDFSAARFWIRYFQVYSSPDHMMMTALLSRRLLMLSKRRSLTMD